MQEENITIRSDRLQVEIARPGTIYSGSRFDWSGFITQVQLDAMHTFCMPESLEPGKGTGGIGLCNEFGNDMPVGFDDAAPGSAFPKLGIGLLTRDEKPYNFFRPYPIETNFIFEVEIGENLVTFTVEPEPVNGYAARLTKSISVMGRTLQISYHLRNLGKKPIVTNEYCHNFLGIDQQTIGPDYTLSFPYKPKFEESWRQFRGMGPKWMRLLPGALKDRLLKKRFSQMQSVLKLVGSELTLEKVPEAPFYARLEGFARTDQAQWELVHNPSGVGAREFVDFTPVRVAVWGVAHVISAEVFVGINLQPDQAMQWSRRYEFFTSVDQLTG